MATSAVDVSSIVDSLTTTPDPTPAPEPTTPELDSPAPELDAAEGISDQPAPDAPEGGEPAAPEVEPKVDGRTNPAAIRSALKSFRDSSPENAPLARELNDGYGRYLAYREAFPTVADARNVKAFVDANGGIEGLTSLHETIKSVNETDSLLYEGDPRVLDSIIEDMRKEGKLGSFTKLAPAFLEKLRGVDEKGYFNVLKPHFYQGLVDTGVPGVVQAMLKALSGQTPDVETAKGLLTEFNNWLGGLRDSVELADKSKLDPDRQAFEQERQQFQTQKQKEFHDSVASEADSYNNRSLGDALKSYVKLPYFKNLASNRESMISLAKELKSTLLEELSADKTYRSQMDAFFAQKSPDKARITQYHQAKIDTMAKRIVKQVIERRYPDYAKRTAVAPKPGTPGAKPAAAAPQAGQPEYVKAKPEWDSIDWDKDPGKMLFITGKAYLKNGKFVYWGKPRK